MNTNQKHAWCFRILIYAIGMVVLAAGITLNTKTGLGVSPIISIPFTISYIWNLNFGMMTFAVYSVFVGLQFLLKGSARTWLDLLQIPVSFLFSMLLNLFSDILNITYSTLWQNLILLLAAIIITALGVVMTVNMKLVPNPGDGMAQATGYALHRGVGFGKNVLDGACVILSSLLGYLAAGEIAAIGVGTLLAMVGVGRFIALFNHFLKKPMEKMAGL
ncbi:DUF6198 family protein [[Clostridium] symbiosum]|uniref:YczE/YyaS/YitT family protein n=1 Tax=Clostridium symbiosum TaxID=1512 RepID=UPI001D0881E0|nr:DUF6198 family protein [[Clostridium] symbiosum]MCB6607969.1 DUF6198 family protein [[Clostridium] symbiosum]MCB6931388.1 DUF6198 family protein [[Clostridium] symbiosum]